MMNDNHVGVIIIGDEILNGKRKDKHLTHVIKKLKQHGLSLAWCRYVSDNEKFLTQQLQQSQEEQLPVFCFGGIGATPDDTTRLAAANAFNIKLVRHPEALALIKEEFGTRAYPNRVLMADLPDEAIIIPNAFNNIPGFTLFEHHFFPGFPQLAWPMLDWVIENYYPSNHERENEESVRVFNIPESELFNMLEYFAEKYPKLKVFSLPSMTNTNSIELGFRGEGLAPSRALNELVSNLKSRNITFISEQTA